MSRTMHSAVLRRFLCAAMILVVSVANAARAADPLQDDTSLKFVPDTVAFYSTSLRLREIYEKVAASRAMAQLQQMPVVQMGLAMAMAQWETPQNPALAMFKQALADPQNQQLVAMLKDAVSHELFVYGSADFGEVIALFNEVNGASNAAQVEVAASGDFENLQEVQFRKILEVLDRRGDQLKLPALVVGAKLTDAAAAVAQLQRLENQVNAMLVQQPVLQQRFQREKIADAEYLTLRLDGSLVPWDMLMQQAQGVDPQQMQQLIAKLSTLKLAVSIGVRDDYLLLSLGDDSQHLADLGKGNLLYDRSELAPVRKAADLPITGVSYSSTALVEQAGSMETQLNQIRDMVKQLVVLAGLSVELQQELTADLDKLFTALTSHAPKPAAVSGYSYLTAAGFEGFQYRWSTDGAWDASQKLTILEQLGGDPIAFWAGRGKSNPQQTDILSELLGRVLYYTEKILLERADLEQQEAYAKIREQLRPLAEDMLRVTREKLVPAFADGQTAFVLDAKSVSESWHVEMPPADGELPMLEIAMVSGVSNATFVEDAFRSYFDILQQMLDKLHELSTGELQDAFPNEIPAIQLVKPQSRPVGDAAVYYYTLPAESRLDAQVAPNAGLSPQFMVVSVLPRFTARLLAATPLQGQGPLTKTDRPLAVAGHLDFARLVESVEPWVDYALQIAMGFDLEGGAAGPMGDIPQQVHDALDVLKCFRGVSGVTYQEGNAMITHTEMRFEDLP